jgi:NADH-quinone oxidoreductase subunit N
MNTDVIYIEICAAILGIFIVVVEAVAGAYTGANAIRSVPGSSNDLNGSVLRRALGPVVFFGLCVLFIISSAVHPEFIEYAFGKSYIMDGLAIFSKQFFIITAIFITALLLYYNGVMRIVSLENYAFVVFALIGMMFAASANHFIIMFVSLELVTVSFYLLTSFRKRQRQVLEASIKYLIYSAAASAFLIYGIALTYGATGTMSFAGLSEFIKSNPGVIGDKLLNAGLAMILVGLGFKVAIAPFQFWVPDVYQGAPSPAVAFLATGSKAVGLILIIRLISTAAGQLAVGWREVFIAIAAITILYGNLCAIPQRNVKRLIGYSSISHAGYLFMGIAAFDKSGIMAILYYLFIYMLALVAFFGVLMIISKDTDNREISLFAGLSRRSPFLAFATTISLASLAGIPPCAGFMGKFLLIKSVLTQTTVSVSYYYLIGIAIAGVAISIYYYFNIIKEIYWSDAPVDAPEISIPVFMKAVILVVVLGVIYYGVQPSFILNFATTGAQNIAINP